MPSGSGLVVTVVAAVYPFFPARAAIRLTLVELTSTQPFRSFFTVAAVAASHWLDAHKLHANGKKGLVQIALRTPPNATNDEKRFWHTSCFSN
jgi:hypothetical protein